MIFQLACCKYHPILLSERVLFVYFKDKIQRFKRYDCIRIKNKKLLGRVYGTSSC